MQQEPKDAATKQQQPPQPRTSQTVKGMALFAAVAVTVFLLFHSCGPGLMVPQGGQQRLSYPTPTSANR